jgi:maleate isomerase
MPPINRTNVSVALEALRPRLGLILLSTDLTSECDVARGIAPDEARVHATRVAFCNPTTPENLRAMAPRLTEAAALLVPDVPLAAICYGCTAASVAIGEDAVAAAIGAARPGVPVVTPVGAARRALEALDARRIAVLTPYLEQTTRPLVAYLSDAGFGVLTATYLGMADDREMARVSGATIVKAARAADTPEAEALFISCTALPALQRVAEIEAALGKPVVTSNQACIWEMRRLAGLPPASAASFGMLMAAGVGVPA